MLPPLARAMQRAFGRTNQAARLKMGKVLGQGDGSLQSNSETENSNWQGSR